MKPELLDLLLSPDPDNQAMGLQLAESTETKLDAFWEGIGEVHDYLFGTQFIGWSGVDIPVRLRKEQDKKYLLRYVQAAELCLNDMRRDPLPEGIRFFRRLEPFVAFGRRLSDLPQGIFTLPRLDTLVLTNNQLTEQPQEVMQIKGLRRLYLSHNQLETLPDSLAEWTQLEELYLSGNRFREVPG